MYENRHYNSQQDDPLPKDSGLQVPLFNSQIVGVGVVEKVLIEEISHQLILRISHVSLDFAGFLPSTVVAPVTPM